VGNNKNANRKEGNGMSALRELRQKTGESMSAVALRAGVEPALLSLVERGKRPCRRTAERIAAALNVKPERVWPDFKTFRDR
jgi:transcriptional regulator with XRE-family HTH domain